MDRRILHVDMDAFFASVEQRDHPQWRGLPVIVGGMPGEPRGVVSAASYEARAYGVRSAMPVSQAFRLCPQGIFVPPRMERYHEVSMQVMRILENYSPDVTQMSVDEAFVDITGTERLLGAPEECAMALKAEVREKTGLTVSVGMASNRYVAKIASAMAKPDGLSIVPCGEEQRFMLSLPLEKLWGAGKKTLCKLGKLGLHTTAQVRDCPQELLRREFGAAGGQFLYRAVRGQEAEDFMSEAKSRSLSVEETYPHDLSDEAAIDAALLQLSCTLMFRLHRQGLSSSRICVKIRYDDFSTVSAQAALGACILSTEELFAKAKGLFLRKYDGKSGVRLLGISLKDVGTGAEEQKSLFDGKEQKQHRIEKAIVAMQEKDPSIRLRKASLLGGKILALAAAGYIALCALAQPLHCQETDGGGAGTLVFNKMLPPLAQEEPPVSLFDYDIRDSRMEFLAQGYWQTLLRGTATATFGHGNGLSIEFGDPVVTQEVDLSLWFLLNRRWYFEAAFADNFEKNTVAAGYYGDGYLKHARVANRGIAFPTSYSIDVLSHGIGGGDNEAPGVMASLSGDKWSADAAIRYDMLEARSRTWYGRNLVSQRAISPQDYQTGAMYVLPSAQITADIAAVYVEDRNGPHADAQGRRFRRLSESEYLAVPTRCQLLLASTARARRTSGALPAVLVAFGSYSAQAVSAAIGDYGTAGTFLGDVQEWFGSADEDGARPDLRDFSYEGICGSGWFSTVEGAAALIVQHPAGFSPFAAAFRYDGGSSGVDSARIISQHSGQDISGYEAVIADDDASFVSVDFLSSERAYIEVWNSKGTQPARPDAALSPAVRYPFADAGPGYYLGYGTPDDYVIALESYTPVTRYDIGTDAAGGTVRVYRNGMIDSGARYDAESGEVTLSGAAGTFDRIHIVWYEDSGSRDNGSVAAAAGLAYRLTPNVSADISLSSRWAYTGSDTFASEGDASPSFVYAASGLSYSNDIVEIKNTIGGGIETDDMNGWYRIMGMDDKAPQTVFLDKSAAVNLPDGFCPRLNGRGAAAGLPELTAENDVSREAESGHSSGLAYGYDIPVSWNFADAGTPFSAASPHWCAMALKLGSGAAALASATEFSIGIMNPRPERSNFEVYLQLGVKATDSFSVENTAVIPTWRISCRSATDALPEDVTGAFIPSAGGYQVATVLLSDADRARLAADTGARLIIVQADDIPGDTAGTVYVNSWECVEESFVVSASQGVSVSARQEVSTLRNSVTKRLNDSTNYMQAIRWDTSGAAGSPRITAQKYISATDMSRYRKFGMLFQSSQACAMQLRLDTLKDGLTVPVLHLDIVEDAYPAGIWNTLVVDMERRSVSVNGTELPAQHYSLYTSPDEAFTHIALTIYPDPAQEVGVLCMDEFYMRDSVPRYTGEDALSVSLRKDGTVLEAGVLRIEDVSLSAQAAGRTAREQRHDRGQTYSYTAGIRGGATISGIRAEGNVTRNDDGPLFSEAGHLLRSDGRILRGVSFSEIYQVNSDAMTLRKENAAGLDLAAWGIPAALSVSAQSSALSYSQSQEAGAQCRIGLPVALTIGSTVSQKRRDTTRRSDTGSYGGGWREATALALSSGKDDAYRRAVGVRADIETSVSVFRPKLSYTADGVYTNSTSARFSDTAGLTLSVPLTLGRQRLAFTAQRKGGGVSGSDGGGSYARDFDEMRGSRAGKYLYSTAPAADLFSGRLPRLVSEATEGTQTQFYSCSYTLSWKRPLSTGIQDMILPISCAGSVQRDIRTAATVSDTYQLKGTASWTALNMLGKDSARKLLTLYEQDEFNSSLGITARIPRGDASAAVWLINGYFQAAFYTEKGSSLKTGMEFSFEDADNCSGKFTLSWSRSGKTSPMLGVASLLSRKIRERERAGLISITRSDSINISGSRAASPLAEQVARSSHLEYAHDAEIALSKYLTLTANLSAGLRCVPDQLNILTLSGGIGGKVQF